MKCDELNIRCGLRVGSICHTEATVRLRSLIPLAVLAHRFDGCRAAHPMCSEQQKAA